MSFARYLITQAVAYAVDLGIFASLVIFSMFGPIPANVVSKISAGCLAFFLNRSYTFRAQGSGSHPQMVRYALLFAANVPLSALMLWIVLHFIANPVIAKIVTDVAFVLTNYWLSRHWVFPITKDD